MPPPPADSEPTTGPRAARIAVIALGDLGRSPRMQYHAIALADAGFEVDLIGLAGTPVREEVDSRDSIRCHRLPIDSSQERSASTAALAAPRKLAVLCRLLWRGIAPPDAILVQTPPAFPTLPVAATFARRRKIDLVVDWHNLGHTILALGLGATHPLVRITRWIESRFGARADASFCVSQAMRRRLAADYGIAEATVLYDRPALRVDDTSGALAVRRRLGIGQEAPLFVTATSWTRDENLDLLLDAAAELDRSLADSDAAPTVVACGEGPARARFEARLRETPLARVRVQTEFLPWSDYALLLATADLGVSLHISSSAVDLPMKISDMIGCGLPVCAYDYGDAIRELIREGDNGYLFRSATELAGYWREVCQGRRFRQELSLPTPGGAQSEWQSNWNEVARPIFERLLASRSERAVARGSD